MMKKLLLVVTGCFILISVNAQITLTQSNTAYQIGDSYQCSQVNSSAINNDYVIGANQIWDYSTISPTTAFTIDVITPASTPYSGNFPNANIATSNSTNSDYDYYESDASSFQYNGSGKSTNYHIMYSNTETRFDYPFTYGDSIYDTYYYQIPSLSYVCSGTSIIKAEGYGTLITPAGTFNNVLKVTTISETFDTAYGMTNNYYHYNIIKNEWFDNVSKYPLFTIFTYTGSYSGKSVSYLINPATPTIELSWNTTTFQEDLANDGSISTILNLTLTGETFTVSSGAITDFTSNNVPSGLTVSITATSSITATIELTGNASSHLNADDVSNMEITFLNAAFTGGDTSIVTNYSQLDLIVDFYDPTTINNIENNSLVSIYPNPSKGQFTIEGDDIQKIEILDITGKSIYTVIANGVKQSVDLSNNLKGVYLARITLNNRTINKKIIIK